MPVRGSGDVEREIRGLTLTEDNSVGGDGDWLRGGVGVGEPSDLTLATLRSDTDISSFAPSVERMASVVSGCEVLEVPNCTIISL